MKTLKMNSFQQTILPWTNDDYLKILDNTYLFILAC